MQIELVIMKQSRGLRNNNPLNIRRNNTKWQGLAPRQTDRSFFVFLAPEWGYRAAIRTLQNYERIHGLKTVRQWINRWAPPSENNTEGYIAFVCERAGVTPETMPNVLDKAVMCNIVAAMSYMENGVPANIKDVVKGWELL